ncbi:transcriptional regulator [Streptomyces cinnamoneus]|uniref:Transcriptional regulator n=1 Tax=Streptomyces cinnamoneus TaxID=53446 RepID=A0A2G1XFT9_STRCJ|nr:helix-turn-helix transcriptional regulator [Streptomyces cinnamoneus]PHQ50104.1 transcriptional regulator [Streptomyces cinnamoneus]PPT13115.1 XRE family transcriptional regulator [Streptomyces cinnamoneus]
MPPSTPLPTIRRRRLGAELRRLRERADMSATEAGALLGATQSRISNIEAGRYGVSADRVRALARIYDCSDQALIEALAGMTGERKRGWWEEYRELLPASLLDLAEVEHHATAIRVSQVINIPGLLQTTDYARAIFREAVPELVPHEVEHRISHRIKRQAVLYRKTQPAYTAIIHEAALRMQFGGTAVTKSQLKHLLAMSERENITVVVIPFDGTSFPSAGHGIDCFRGTVPQLDTVLLDTAHNGTFIDASAQLDRCRLVLDRMESVALKPDLSRDLIHGIAQNV